MKKLPLILSFGFLSVTIVFLLAYFTYGEDSDLQYLIDKYPTIIDLKHGVDSGELDYNKLPIQAKKALDRFNANPDSILNLTLEN